MDAWASPWAEDTTHNEDSSHSQEQKKPTNNPGAGSPFASKLDTTEFGGASVWATDEGGFGSVDSSSAWASNSLQHHHHQNDVFPNWGENQSTAPAVQDGYTSFSNALVGDLNSSVVKTGITEDWTQQLQSDWEPAVVSHSTAETSPSVAAVKTEITEDWTKHLQSDWEPSPVSYPSAEASPNVPEVQERLGSQALRSTPAGAFSTEEEIWGNITIEEEQPKPVIEERPKPEIQEQPKPEIQEQPTPEVEAQPKPEIEEQSKSVIYEQPMPEIDDRPESTITEPPGATVPISPVDQGADDKLEGGLDQEWKGDEELNDMGIDTEPSSTIAKQQDDQNDNVNEDDDDDFGDFGDVEEGEMEDMQFEPEPEPELAPAPEPISVAFLKATPLSPLDFTIDSSLASKLYPLVQKPLPIAPAEDIISSSSTRKAWYRISRHGTMGKHNSGEGDDYIRITWQKSKVRTDVCEVVNRWMKEGKFSVSGGMGGDRNYGAMFGWGDGAVASKESDKKGNRASAPMGLGSLGLGSSEQRMGLKSVHKASVSISSWDPLASGKPKDASPVVDFGWASPKTPKEHKTKLEENPATPKKGQALSTRIIPTPSGVVSRETTNTLKTLVDSSMKADAPNSEAQPVIVQKPPHQLKDKKVVPNNDVIEQDSWGDFEKTMNTNPSDIDVGKPVESGASDGNSWASLGLFEKKTVSHATAQPNSQALPDKQLHDLGFSFEETPQKQLPNASEFESTVDDDDWGEMINSPATSIQPASTYPRVVDTTFNTASRINRRPSTAGGDVHPFSNLQISELGATKSPTIKMDSAPPIVPMNGVSTLNMSVVQSTNQEKQPETANWDFSLFERPTQEKSVPKPPSPAQPSRLERGIGGSQTISKDDKLVMDILQGLPDVGYMLR